MIKIKCDICGEEDRNINTIILYKKKIDYCNKPKCTKKAYRIAKELEKEIKVQNMLFNFTLKSKENQLIKDMKK